MLPHLKQESHVPYAMLQHDNIIHSFGGMSPHPNNLLRRIEGAIKFCMSVVTAFGDSGATAL